MQRVFGLPCLLVPSTRLWRTAVHRLTAPTTWLQIPLHVGNVPVGIILKCNVTAIRRYFSRSNPYMEMLLQNGREMWLRALRTLYCTSILNIAILHCYFDNSCNVPHFTSLLPVVCFIWQLTVSCITQKSWMNFDEIFKRTRLERLDVGSRPNLSVE